MLMIKRLISLACLNFNISATISLALLKAVSPDVTGAVTTPSKASTLPTLPKSVLEIRFAAQAALF